MVVVGTITTNYHGTLKCLISNGTQTAKQLDLSYVLVNGLDLLYWSQFVKILWRDSITAQLYLAKFGVHIS